MAAKQKFPFPISFAMLPLQNNGRVIGSDDEHDTRKISDFDTADYIAKNGYKDGEDAYARNAYNLKVSDKIAFDREVPEVRDAE